MNAEFRWVQRESRQDVPRRNRGVTRIRWSADILGMVRDISDIVSLVCTVQKRTIRKCPGMKSRAKVGPGADTRKISTGFLTARADKWSQGCIAIFEPNILRSPWIFQRPNIVSQTATNTQIG